MRRHERYKRSFQFEKCKRRYHGLKDRLEALASSRGIYRSRKGLFMGVCRGLAEYFNFSVFWLRIVTLLLFLFTGFWPIGVMYIVAGLLLKMEPVSPLHNEKDQEFYDTYTHSRQSAVQRIKRKFENIERRIQRMEHTVTSREFDWE
ncbi:MAG: envelope stress response membrane protein PspC [Proteobacteria bacterium]|nr:envelope stress response membrane protein PspC [Pseudomonadota bacterium]MBU1584491.1 envelope stress response membrane protein PspC [Pseudomonadota bacterium]MBU2456062.1 envelope stress response membrane protein PspC [Pseudomonadota bacterium]MBU2631004.1 envelope stress response membrane protein PspC [Pseudomonadota bacterium]